MPAQQSGWADSECSRPASAWQPARQGSEQRSIVWPILDSSALASQHPELMTQHEDLKLLRLTRASEQDQELEDPAKGQIHQGEHAPPPARWI